MIPQREQMPYMNSPKNNKGEVHDLDKSSKINAVYFKLKYQRKTSYFSKANCIKIPVPERV